MKKRLFSLVFALALCLGLMVPVSAEETASVVWLDEVLVPSGSFGFDDGMIGVRRNKGAYQYGFVDQTSKFVIPLQYSEVKRFTRGWFRSVEQGILDGIYGAILTKPGKRIFCAFTSWLITFPRDWPR